VIQYRVERKRWGENTPPNFDARTVVMKNKALLQPCNRHHEKQQDKCQ
jgi:hypothetical protein